MTHFFYADNNQQYGPFTFQELQTKNITPETLVWHEGLTDWTPAGNLTALKDMFTSLPPVIPTDVNKPVTDDPYKNHPKPNNNLALAICATALCCMPLGIFALIQSSKVDKLYYLKDFAGAQRAANLSKKISISGFILGAIFGILYILLLIFIEARNW